MYGPLVLQRALSLSHWSSDNVLRVTKQKKNLHATNSPTTVRLLRCTSKVNRVTKRCQPEPLKHRKSLFMWRMLRSERFSKWRHVAHGLKLERVLWAAKKAGITPWNAAHTHTQAHLITTVREHTWGVLAYSPPTNSSHLRNLTFKEGDSADVKQTEWTRTKHLNIKCSMIVFLPLHEISQGDLKKYFKGKQWPVFHTDVSFYW